MRLRSAAARTLASCAAFAVVTALPGYAQEGAGDVVFVPTPQVVVERMLAMAKVGPNDFVIDLGSGDGRMVITAARQFGARGFGVDLDDVLLESSNAIAKAEGVADRARFIKENLFDTDLGRATVITTYLLPEMNERLRPKILALKPGTRVVAHDYHMGDWYPDENDMISVPEKKVGNPGKSYVYLWYVPANASGKWQVKLPGQNLTFDLDFSQTFQMLDGSANVNGKPAKIQGGRVRGDEVAFLVVLGADAAATKHEFTGKINGDVMTGQVTIRADKDVKRSGWTAMRSARGKMNIGAVAPAGAAR